MHLHIGCRSKAGTEDRRFANVREAAVPKLGVCGYDFVMWLVFVINAGTILALNASGLTICMQSSGEELTWLDYVGVVVWAVGFLILLIADSQVTAWKGKRERGETGEERLCKTGLWAWSRHPNYFGEAILWWGIYLISIGVDGGWTTFFSPIILFLLLRYVSGVPTVENLYADSQEFIIWKEKTSTFILWPPKSTEETAELV